VGCGGRGGMRIAVGLCSAALGLPWYSFAGTNTSVTIAAQGENSEWTGQQARGRVAKPGVDKAREFFVLPGAVPHLQEWQEVAKTTVFEEHADEVDNKAAYEKYLISRGQTTAEGKVLGNLLKPLVYRVESVARKEYSCAECAVCHAYLRSYQPGERRDNPPHFDMEAYATFVASLSPASNFTGGIYIQQNASRASGEYLALQAGDILGHRYDLSHGVEVMDGGRFTIILWLSNSAGACAEGHSPWYVEEGVVNQDSDALWNAGLLFKRGAAGFSQSHDKAAQMFKSAADMGHAQALNNLGLAYSEGDGVPKSPEEALMLWKKSADLGYVQGMLNYASTIERGGESGAKTAVEWYKIAAERERSPTGARYLAEAYTVGKGGLSQDYEEGIKWFLRAGDLGDTKCLVKAALLYQALNRNAESIRLLSRASKLGEIDALYEVGRAYERGVGVSADITKAMKYYGMAGKSGHEQALQRYKEVKEQFGQEL